MSSDSKKIVVGEVKRNSYFLLRVKNISRKVIHQKRWLLIVETLVCIVLIGAIAWYILYLRSPASKQKSPNFKPSLLSVSIEKEDLKNLTDQQKYLHYLTLADSYQQEKKTEQSLETLIQAEKLTKTPDVTLIQRIINVATELHKDDILKTYTQKLGTVTPSGDTSSPSGLLRLAQIYDAAGNKQKAIEYYESFLKAAKFADLAEPDGKTFAPSLKSQIESRINELKK